MIAKRRKKSGFIAFVCLFLLVIFGLMGIAYWYSSRMNTDMFYMESLRIKAKNYAQAGVETVKINIRNNIKFDKNYDMNLATNKHKDYEKVFEDGGFRVTSIKPLEIDGIEYRNRMHFVRGRATGAFDVWVITVEGYTKKPSVVVELKTTVRVFHEYAVY